MHRQTVYRWEWGQLEPSLENLRALSRVLRCSFNWLVTGRGVAPKYLRQGGE